MSLFNKKETIVLKSEQQKDTYIERLEKAHVEYDVFEDRDTIYSRDVSYIIRVKASDLTKLSTSVFGSNRTRRYLRLDLK